MRHSAKLKIAVGAVAGLLLLALILAGSIRSVYAGEALPGTELAGSSLAGLTAEDIRDRLNAEIVDQPQALRLRTGSGTIRIKPAEAGRVVDVETTTERALSSGREGALGGLPATLAGLFATREIDVAIEVDRRKLERSVASVADRIDRPSFPGSLLTSVEDGVKTGIEPPRPGRQVDRARLTRRLRAALLDPSKREITVPVERLDVVSPEEVEAVARKADRLLANPIRIGPIQLDRARMADLLELEPLEDSLSVRLGVKPEGLEELVDSIAARIDRDARDAEITPPASPPATVSEKGDLNWRPVAADISVSPARPGRAVDREALATSIEDAVQNEESRVALPVDPVKPAVTTADARKVDYLIGTFTTFFEPGQPRVTNIQTMARTVNGTVVPAGSSFSLNGRVGRRTRAKGYVPAPMIADGKLVPAVGGGVSQFSTTIYNAAFFAGIQLDAYQPHSLYIDRYPAGRESTLDYPSIDLAWTNDTDAPILISSSSDESSVTVMLYGDNGGRRVSSRSSPRRDVPDADFAIDVTRVIRFPGGRVDSTTRTTTYQHPE